jgi:dephospho-CoA kinase
MALVIGGTGSIASGKSTVCQTVVELGGVHGNADTLVHQLYAPGTPGFARVVTEFGPEVVGPDGSIDRRVLGSKVFGNPEAMRRLTRAMGDITGLIRRTIEEWRATLPAHQPAVLEAVNLIEPGYAAWCDQVWLVTCSPETARARLAARNNLPAEEVEKRLASQRDWRLRAPAADLVLHNDGGPEELRRAVRAELNRILALHRTGALPPTAYHRWRARQAQDHVR